MFCCFRKLAGMQSFPACDPKIASEYLPLCQPPEHLPLYQTLNTLPLYQTLNTLPLYQRGPGGFTDRPKKTPNTSLFANPRTPPSLPIPEHLPLCQSPNTSLFANPRTPPSFAKPRISPPFAKGAGGIFTIGEGYKPCFHTTPDSTPRPRPAPNHDRRRAPSLVAGA
jgi:hypothetical protein